MIVDDQRLRAPSPIRSVERTSRTSERVASLFHGVPDATMGYGATLHLEQGGRTLTTRTYCWCGSGSCPWCAGCIDSDNWDGSAHALLTAAEVWAAHGFVTGKEAPNLWYRDAHTGVDARVWWYKYIGRGMEASLTGPLSTLDAVVDAARPLVVDHLGGLLPNLWRNA